MGWYEATMRPAMLALPPEASHRLAGALLSLPLPWSRIGGTPQDASLEVDVAGLTLRNPVGLAAGFDKTCRHLDALAELGFGSVTGGTITRHPRRGNAKPRIARNRATASLTNAMGLPNPGADAAARALARARRVAPIVVSVADEDVGDAIATVELVAPHADAIELNASCPNVAWGRDRDNESHLRELVTSFRARIDVPLFVKVPPFTTDTEREVVLALAGVAADAGADGFVCSNTRPVDDPRLAVGRGGLSGGEIRELTPVVVDAVARATDRPVVACGGIATPDDVRRALDAGARAVQVYTAFVYAGPHLPRALIRGLRQGAEGRSGGGVTPTPRVG
ncbi:MAG TPA: dihydroorotate dehydrogenase 2 [Actinomycetota bacterium]|nr:dihydroorotate dehydrogenase 2 [Actinomycetota bacterium]